MGHCPNCSVNTGVELVRNLSAASPDGGCFLKLPKKAIVLKLYEAVQEKRRRERVWLGDGVGVVDGAWSRRKDKWHSAHTLGLTHTHI